MLRGVAATRRDGPPAPPAPEPEAPAAPAPAPAPAEAPTLRARIATHLDALLKEVDLDEMNMKSLRKKVAADLDVEISGEDKDWFKEHVTRRVQARAEPDEEDEDQDDGNDNGDGYDDDGDDDEEATMVTMIAIHSYPDTYKDTYTPSTKSHSSQHHPITLL